MNIRNLEDISTSPMRRMILGELPGIFEELDPTRLSEKSISGILDPASVKGSIYVLGFGKASVPMYEGVRKFLGKSIRSAWIIIPEDDEANISHEELKVLRGTHPITGKRTVESSTEALNGLDGIDENDVVIVLVSGGGSALFEIPVHGVDIKDIADASQCLMDSDADIYELNSFRRFFSAVKGGRLAERLWPAKVIGLIISDVFGDDLSVIASGPLTESERSRSALQSLVESYGQKCPILSRMASEADVSPPLHNRYYGLKQKIILRNLDFVAALQRMLEGKNEDCVTLGSNINGEVSEVTGSLEEALAGIASLKKKDFWFVFGGETTVNVSGDGQGGRNQELALRMLMKLRDRDFFFMSIGTDGIDGKSPAMGGISDSVLADRLTDQDINDCLSRSDSFSLLQKYGSAILTGRTGTNVSDVAVGYYGMKK